jgi:hypothetical protein
MKKYNQSQAVADNKYANTLPIRPPKGNGMVNIKWEHGQISVRPAVAIKLAEMGIAVPEDMKNYVSLDDDQLWEVMRRGV